MATTFTLKPVARGAVPITLTTAYTVPALTTTTVRAFDFSNTTPAALSVTVYLVASGGAAGPGNIYMNAITVPPNQPPDGALYSVVLAAGDFISWIASGVGCNGYISAAEEA